MKGKILITEEVHPLLIEGLTACGYSCHYVPGISVAETRQVLAGYRGIVIASRMAVDAGMLEQAAQLKFIARAGSGMEQIDLKQAAALNIHCINAPEGNASSVGEHAAGLILALFHHIVRSAVQTRSGFWKVYENRVHEVQGKVLAIIGYGNTGKALAQKVCGFQLEVIAWDKYRTDYGDPYATAVSEKEVYSRADIVSYHIPLTEETQGLVDGDYLQRFSRPVHLINTSRGAVIRHRDLLEAIRNQQVLGAGLDVYENEHFDQLTAEERIVFTELNETGKVIFTPHIAGKSFESPEKIARVLLEKIVMLG